MNEATANVDSLQALRRAVDEATATMDRLAAEKAELLAALEKIHARADGGSTWTDIAYIARAAIEKARAS
jgi:hypothetical protein